MTAKWTSEERARPARTAGRGHRRRTPAWGFETPGSSPRAARRWCWRCRDTDKGKAAAARIAGTTPGADVTVQPLDLTCLDSIRAAAAELRAGTRRSTCLITTPG